MDRGTPPRKTSPKRGGGSLRKQVKFSDESEKDQEVVGDTFLASEEHDAFRAVDDEGGHVKWIVDSGATSHMSTSMIGMVDVKSTPGVKVNVAGGIQLSAVGRGTMRVIAHDSHGTPWQILITDVIVVPDLGVNLLSVPKLAERGILPVFNPKDPYLELKGRRTLLSYERVAYTFGELRVKCIRELEHQAERMQWCMLVGLDQPICGIRGLHIEASRGSLTWSAWA